MVVKQVSMTCFFCFGSDGSNEKKPDKNCQAQGYPNISYFKKGSEKSSDSVDLYCDVVKFEKSRIA